MVKNAMDTDSFRSCRPALPRLLIALSLPPLLISSALAICADYRDHIPDGDREGREITAGFIGSVPLPFFAARAGLATAPASPAGPASADPVDSRGTNTSVGVAWIPLELSGNRTYIQVRVAGSRPLRLLLDTGMPMDGVFLFHREFEKEARLDALMEVRIPGAGGGEPSTAVMADSVPLSAGDIQLGRQRVIISRSESTQNFPSDGIIGWSLFGSYAVELDYDRMMITLHPPTGIAPDSSWQPLPLTLKENIPWISAAVDVLGKGPVPIECYIDFASDDAIELLVRADNKFPMPEKLEPAYLGTGLSGDIHGQVGRVVSLTIGSHLLRELPAAFAPAEIRSKQENADGVIGNQALRRFNLIFDYAGSKLWIKPNGAFAEPF